MSDYLDVLRRITQIEGYTLDTGELAQATAHHPDAVCGLITAACFMAAADGQIEALTTAANLLCDVHASGNAETVLSLRERLDRIGDALTRALAQRDKGTARLRHHCDALTETGTALITRTCDGPPPADHPDGAGRATH